MIRVKGFVSNDSYLSVKDSYLRFVSRRGFSGAVFQPGGRPLAPAGLNMTRMRDDNQPPIRCAWARSPLMIRYHDQEWGVPVHDDRTLFEFLILEGAQAGLSWETILRKRENYRRA